MVKYGGYIFLHQVSCETFETHLKKILYFLCTHDSYRY